MSEFGQDVCRNLELATRREWLETNGLGGFASSTIVGLNTRRYHGLLVATMRPPVERLVLLSKLEETLIIDGRRVDLSANQYPGAIYPQGYRYLKHFRQAPFPVFTYEVDGVELEKSIFMVHGENTTVVGYTLRNAGGAVCRLEVRPLIAFRDYHSTTHENGSLNGSITESPGLVMCCPYPGLPSLHLAHTGAEFQRTGEWYRNFEYAVEQQRGLDFHEDLFNPLVLKFDLQRYPQVAVIASTEPRDVNDAERLCAAEIKRRSALTPELCQAADQFLVRRGDESTVIAGYHWFSDWGRDTMIALPGLTLTTGRPEIAKSILRTFAASVDRGMLPNRFPDSGETPEYNTVDATLWFFEAVRAYSAHTGDYEFVRAQLYDSLVSVIDWHERGTRYGIQMDTDGLLRAGEPGVQLTWMDARVNGREVTPRTGKPVEIQALWYNALRVMEDLADRFGSDRASHYRDLAGRAAAAFAPLFWNEAAGCLYDVVDGKTRDGAIRPNQIFAVSLFHKILPVDLAKRVVEKVEQYLLTPYGLRTLATSDPQYRGRFEGDPASRDGAYHQGTVWPWLIGPFLTGYLEVNGHSDEAHAQALKWLAELRRYANDEGCGQIPEVFDGDAPHRPGGCMAQAWSVAEVLRALTARAPLPTVAAVSTSSALT